MIATSDDERERTTKITTFSANQASEDTLSKFSPFDMKASVYRLMLHMGETPSRGRF